VPQRLTDYPGPRPFGDVFDQVVLDGGLVFAADDGSHGREPWWSDGTAGGTRLLADVAGGPAGGACVADASTLCLGEGRFRVTVDWHNQHAPVGVPDTGVGGAISAAGEDDSGFFWFFRPDNVELAVKVLDGRTANGYFWVFFGALSDVEYWVRVEDTVGGGERIYHNPPGRICGQSDTAAFPVGGPSAGGSIVGDGGAGLEPVPGDGLRLLTLDPPEPLSAADTAPVEPCPEGDGILCLLGGGLAVDVQWFVSRFGIGQGHAVPFTDRTGFFWFFRPGNVELVVKALDGRTVNGKIWVFYGALSDVSYSIRVVDRAGGGMRTYDNPQGNLCGRGDTAAF
jgi:ELWxxDGT repeat protein